MEDLFFLPLISLSLCHDSNMLMLRSGVSQTVPFRSPDNLSISEAYISNFRLL